jgi:hypothetical protein
MTLLRNYAGSKQKSSKMTQIQLLATQGKAKPCTESMRLKYGGGEAYQVINLTF